MIGMPKQVGPQGFGGVERIVPPIPLGRPPTLDKSRSPIIGDTPPLSHRYRPIPADDLSGSPTSTETRPRMATLGSSEEPREITSERRRPPQAGTDPATHVPDREKLAGTANVGSETAAPGNSATSLISSSSGEPASSPSEPDGPQTTIDDAKQPVMEPHELEEALAKALEQLEIERASNAAKDDEIQKLRDENKELRTKLRNVGAERASLRRELYGRPPRSEPTIMERAQRVRNADPSTYPPDLLRPTQDACLGVFVGDTSRENVRSLGLTDGEIDRHALRAMFLVEGYWRMFGASSIPWRYYQNHLPSDRP